MSKQQTYPIPGTDSIKDRELMITRLLNAPRDLVFKVWTEPDHIAQWWGPSGFTNTIHEMNVKPGGEWRFVMHGPDGKDYKNKSIFVEIVQPERIVFDHFAPNFRATVTFEAVGKQTRLTWQMVFETPEQKSRTVKENKADEGLRQNVDRLVHYLSNLTK